MKQITLFRTNKRKMRANKKGGVEGLPLQLLIIIVVASLGLAMMVGWFNGIEEPDMIDSIEASYEKVDGAYEVTVRVLDQNGYGIEGADVILTGYGAYTLTGGVANASSEEYLLVQNVYIDGVYYSQPTPVLKSAVQAAGYDVSKFETVTIGTGSDGPADRATPHGVTDEEGFAVITVHFDSLKTYGTLNIEVSKTGYTGSNTTMKVFA